MAGLYNKGDTLRLEDFGERMGDLLCEPFLHLEPSRKHFDYSSDFREANDSVVRDVSHVHLARLACSS